MNRLTLKRILQIAGLLWFLAGLANCIRVASQVGVTTGSEVMFLIYGMLFGPLLVLAGFLIPREEGGPAEKDGADSG